MTTKAIWTIKVYNEKDDYHFTDSVAFEDLKRAEEYCKLCDDETYKHYVNETTLVIG